MSEFEEARVRDDERKYSLEEYASLIEGINCRFCDAPIMTDKIEVNFPESNKVYYHSGGFPVEGYEAKIWLWIQCTKCKHQWSLVHLIRQADAERTRAYDAPRCKDEEDEQAQQELAEQESGYRHMLGFK